MSTGLDPRRSEQDDWEWVRPTQTSSWIAVIVLGVGVALGLWFVAVKPVGDLRRTVMPSGSPTDQPKMPSPKPMH